MENKSIDKSQLPIEIQDFIEEIEYYPWLKPKNPDFKKLELLVNEHQQHLSKLGRTQIFPLKLVEDWKVAHRIAKDVVSGIPKYAQWNATRLHIMEHTRITIDEIALNESIQETEKIVKSVTNENFSEAIWHTIHDLTINVLKEELKDIMLDASWAVSYDVARCATWLLVEDKMLERGYKNPFKPLMKIYKMGLWPMGLIREKTLFGNKRFFAVFVPEIII